MTNIFADAVRSGQAKKIELENKRLREEAEAKEAAKQALAACVLRDEQEVITWITSYLPLAFESKILAGRAARMEFHELREWVKSAPSFPSSESVFWIVVGKHFSDVLEIGTRWIAESNDPDFRYDAYSVRYLTPKDKV